MLSLPREIGEYMATYLDIYSLISLKSTCKRYHVILERLFKQRVQSIPWRIVIHSTELKKEIRIHDVCIAIGDYQKNFIKQTITDDSHNGIYTLNNYDILEHESCYLCSQLVKYDETYVHGEYDVHKSNIHTIIKQGVGGDTIETILSLTTRRNKDICVEFTERHYYDGLMDSPSLSSSQDSLEISYDLFIPKDKVLINEIDYASVETYSLELSGEYIYNSTSCNRVVYGVWCSDQNRVINANDELGDYNLANYRDGVYMDESSEDCDW